MTDAESRQFREKMLALSLVLEDEVKELQEQHNNLMVRRSFFFSFLARAWIGTERNRGRQNITDKGDLGNKLSKSNIRNMKKKTTEQRQNEHDDTVLIVSGEGALLVHVCMLLFSTVRWWANQKPRSLSESCGSKSRSRKARS